MRERHALIGTLLRAGFLVTGTFVSGCGSSADGRADPNPGAIDTRLSIQGDDGGTPPPPDGSFDGSTPGAPSGLWLFDDCSSRSTALLDSSGGGANASHRLGSACAPGVSGLGVSIGSAKDVVEIPDDPQFALGSHVAVAAWIRPTHVTGTHPIVIKESGGHAPFSLSIQSGNVEFSVRLASGKTVTSSAPITVNQWSHVGAFYDGQFVFLFLNGEQVGQVDHAGTLGDVRAPIRVGASAEGKYFEGVIDDLWISTNPVAAGDITALACVQNAPVFSVTESPAGAVSAGTTVNYAIAVTNNDFGFCQPEQYFFNMAGGGFGGGGFGGGGGPVGVDAGTGIPLPPPPVSGSTPAPLAVSPPPGIPVGPVDASLPPVVDSGVLGDAGGPPGEIPLGLQIVQTTSFSGPVSPGQSFTFDVGVTGTVDTDPGTYPLPFQIFATSEQSLSGQSLSGALDFELAAPAGCHVTTGRELMIIDPTVVDDPVRTAFNPSASSPDSGVWTFGRLMRDMAPTPEQAPAMVLGLFQSWLTDQTVNGFTVQARPAMQQTVLDSWPRAADGSLDLNQAPLRLLGIVNRIDTRNLAAGSAGEARFVYGVLDGFGNPLQFTLIVEYGLPATTEADVLGWANAWHALGAHPFPSEEYNAALEALTLRFSGRGVAPSKPNGSALDQLRTNEIALSFQWELREFGLSASTGLLSEKTVALTPDLGLNGTTALADFTNANEAAILADTDTLPDQFEGAPFLGGSIFNNLTSWSAPGIVNNEARFQLSSNTCNGCHGPDTGTTFLQIAPRSPGQESILSGFLTGTTAFDAVTGQPRVFDDLARRNQDLASLVCPTTSLARVSGAATIPAAAKPTLRMGIRRTH
jgi:hypothetical protein